MFTIEKGFFVSKPKKTMVITAALPYANGSIHLGHLVEYIQTDIFTRFQKMNGVRALYFCADDTHGAPIMIRAKQEGVTPEAIIERYQKEHLEDFTAFNIQFDNYHSTNAEENRLLSEEIFLALKDGGHITTRDVEQAYCEHDKMFLPDRFVRGDCPKCGAEEQYGDSCEVCGSHYQPTDLKKPVCSLCGKTPVRKESLHYFFRVADYQKTLVDYLASDALQPEVKNFLKTWLAEGLREWDISRDGPYFGFKIPGEEDKYFYVWLDAPVGYLASAKHWADGAKEDFDTLWKNDKTEIHHFIGKDIVYFHTLFWIPMLAGAGYSLPSKIHVHGFLTINGEKMSKSKGTFINAKDYLAHLDPMYLRYYYACKLKNSVDDLDLSFDDFLFRVNAELTNKIANLGSRTIAMFNKRKELKNRLGKIGEPEREMIAAMQKEGAAIAGHYDDGDFNLAVKKIVQLADVANAYVDSSKPWELKNDPERFTEVLTAGINAFRLIALYLKPVIPAFAEKVEKILNVEPFVWDDHKSTLENHEIGEFIRLADRIEKKGIDGVMDEAKKSAPSGSENKADKKAEKDTTIAFDDFAAIDLRTAKVIAAQKVKKSDRLLKLTLDLAGEERTVVAGIAEHYTPEEVTGKTVLIVANLAPRKLMGVTSHGMVLAVNDGKTLRLLSPDGDAGSGLKVS